MGVVLGIMLWTSSATAMMCEQFFEEAQQAYQAGDYDRAVKSAALSAAIDPKYPPPVPFLRQILPKAYDRHLEKLAEHDRANARDRAEAEVRALVDLAKQVRDLPHGLPLPALPQQWAQAFQQALGADKDGGGLRED
jgi:hypothetical protein